MVKASLCWQQKAFFKMSCSVSKLYFIAPIVCWKAFHPHHARQTYCFFKEALLLLLFLLYAFFLKTFCKTSNNCGTVKLYNNTTYSMMSKWKRGWKANGHIIQDRSNFLSNYFFSTVILSLSPSLYIFQSHVVRGNDIMLPIPSVHKNDLICTPLSASSSSDVTPVATLRFFSFPRSV